MVPVSLFGSGLVPGMRGASPFSAMAGFSNPSGEMRPIGREQRIADPKRRQQQTRILRRLVLD